MEPSTKEVNRSRQVSTSFDRLEIARRWQAGDHSIPEPYLYAHEIRTLLLETTGKGRAEETLLTMGQAGDIPAYQDLSRKTRNGSHPTVFRWSEVMPILAGHGRNQGSLSKIVPIVPKKRGR